MNRFASYLMTMGGSIVLASLLGCRTELLSGDVPMALAALGTGTMYLGVVAVFASAMWEE